MIKKSKQGRIINVTAHAHSAGHMSIDDPLGITNLAPEFHPRDAFAHSKLAIVLWTRKLARLLKSTAVTVNSLTPGLVRGTKHMRQSPIMRAISAKIIMFPCMWIFMKTPVLGAQTAIYLATDEKIKTTSGEYFKWVRLRNEKFSSSLTSSSFTSSLALNYLRDIWTFQIKERVALVRWHNSLTFPPQSLSSYSRNLRFLFMRFSHFTTLLPSHRMLLSSGCSWRFSLFERGRENREIIVIILLVCEKVFRCHIFMMLVLFYVQLVLFFARVG